MDFFQAIATAFMIVIIEHLGKIVAFLIATILAILGVWFGYKQYSLTRSAQPAPLLLDVTLYGISEYDIRDLFILLPFTNNCLFAVPLTLRLWNRSSVSVRDVEVFLEIGDAVYITEGMLREPSNLAMARDVKHAVDPISGTRNVQVFYKLGHISPHTRVTFIDYINVSRETYLINNLRERVADGKYVQATVYIYAHFCLSLAATARDMKPIVKDYNLHFRRGNHGGVETFLKEEMKRRSKVSFGNFKPAARKKLIGVVTKDLRKGMKERGMVAEIDENMPNMFATVRFKNTNAGCWLAEGVEAPKGKQFITVAEEDVRIVCHRDYVPAAPAQSRQS